MAKPDLTVTFDLSCLATGMPYSGVEYYVYHLTRALMRCPEVTAINFFACSRHRRSPELNELARGCGRAVSVPMPSRYWHTLSRVLEWPPVESFVGPTDIVHGAFHSLPPSRYAKRVVTVFDLTHLKYPTTQPKRSGRTHRRLLDHALKNADAIFAISKNCKNDLLEMTGCDPSRVHIAPAGVIEEEFTSPGTRENLVRVERSLGIDRPYFLCLATLEPRKNLIRLIEAYSGLRKRFSDVPALLLVGKRGFRWKSVLEKIVSQKVEDHVRYIGRLDRLDVCSLLLGAYALTYVSLYEGFGLPVLEAMAAGTPVLTSNVSSMPEILGGFGTTVDPEDVGDILAGLEWLIQNYEKAMEYAGQARIRARSYTWTGSADRLTEVYRSLISS